MERRKVKIGFWLENLSERTTRKTRCRWEDNIKLNPKETDGRMWTGLVWLGIGISGGLY
jgi:hypothetical protein